MMSKNIIIILALILSCLTISAQRGQMRGRSTMEQIEAEKVAFFTRYLELSSHEAKEFWPVYEDYRKQRDLIIQERQSLTRYFARNHEYLSEEEAQDTADSYIKLIVKENELAKEFHEKFKNVLPAAKVMHFYQAENEFRRQLLRRLGRGGERGPSRNPEMFD